MWQKINSGESAHGIRDCFACLGRVIFLVLLGIPVSTGLVWAQEETQLVILHTNDIHGQILPRNGVGGMAELATLILRSDADLTLDGGDMFTGTMLADEFQGRPVIEIMNFLGYDAAALGNHEFDYGIEALEARIRDADFPILSANVRGVDGVRPYTVLEVDDLRIGVIGLTVENLAEVTHPKNLTTITVDRLTDVLEGLLPEVRSQSDFVVLVAHIDEDEQMQVAQAFPEIRLIVASHPHVARTETVGLTTIVQTGSSTRNLGRIVMAVVDGEPISITEELPPIENIPADPEVIELIRPYRDAVEDRVSEVLGDASAPLPRDSTMETSLGT
jgi:5'-nucleotidase/UDP-sugar diphosphatase